MSLRVAQLYLKMKLFRRWRRTDRIGLNLKLEALRERYLRFLKDKSGFPV